MAVAVAGDAAVGLLRGWSEFDVARLEAPTTPPEPASDIQLVEAWLAQLRPTPSPKRRRQLLAREWKRAQSIVRADWQRARALANAGMQRLGEAADTNGLPPGRIELTGDDLAKLLP